MLMDLVIHLYQLYLHIYVVFKVKNLSHLSHMLLMHVKGKSFHYAHTEKIFVSHHEVG